MPVVAKVSRVEECSLSEFLPEGLRHLGDLQTAIPRLAKDLTLIEIIRRTVAQIPTHHTLVRGDARKISKADVDTVHLVVTSPPYWTLKQYREGPGQMGHIADYDEFLTELDRVWQKCLSLIHI